jgi:uncharacterized membrane protein YcaP (DUF421 family)
MGSVVRGLVVFLTLLLVFRIAGKRTLHETTTFDFVLLLIIAETVQQAMIDNDNSYINAFILICTLVGVNVLLSLVKQRSPRLQHLLEGRSVVLVERGKVHKDRLDKERVDRDEIITAGRELHGLERHEDIKYAVLEKDGSISIIPRDGPGKG